MRRIMNSVKFRWAHLRTAVIGHRKKAEREERLLGGTFRSAHEGWRTFDSQDSVHI